jgi:hypothetical protein
MKTTIRGIKSRLRRKNIHLIKYLLNVSEKKFKLREKIRCGNISEATSQKINLSDLFGK